MLYLFMQKMLGVDHPLRMPTPTFIIEPDLLGVGRNPWTP